MSEPARVLITGAAGQIGYVLSFLVASGDLFGDRKVFIHLLELKPALPMLEALTMELYDCNYPTLAGVLMTDNVREACNGVDVAFLLGAIPKRSNISISSYLERNAFTFKEQGEALSDLAKPNVKVLVVGMPTNTNCLVALHYAKNLSPSNFCAMTRLDHNRAIAAVSKALNVEPQTVTNVVVWGNRSASQVHDISHVKINGEDLSSKENYESISKEIAEMIKLRTTKVLKIRGASTAASAANSALCHMRDWLFGTKPGDFVSMGVMTPENSPYGIKPGIVFSFPCTIDQNGQYHIVEDLKVSDELMEKIHESEKEILEEYKITFDILNRQT